MRSRILTLSLPLLLAAPAAYAGAAEPRHTLSIDWVANPACTDAEQLKYDVARIVGGPSKFEHDVTVHARVELKDTHQWHVDLVTEVDTASRRRSFDAESCDAAAAGIAFILAVAINPAAAASAPPQVYARVPAHSDETTVFSDAGAPAHASSAPATDAGTPSTPAPTVSEATTVGPAAAPAAPTVPAAATVGPATAPAAPVPALVPAKKETTDKPVPAQLEPALPAPAAPTRPARTPPSPARADNSPRGFPPVTLGAALAFDVGSLPNAAVGGAATLGIQPGRVRIEVEGDYWASQSGAVGGAGATFTLASVRARAGYVWTLGQLTAGPLVGVGIVSIHSAGFGGTAANHTSESPIGAASWGGFATWQVAGPLFLRADLENLIPFSHPAFLVQQAAPASTSQVYQVSSSIVRAAIGAEIHF